MVQFYLFMLFLNILLKETRKTVNVKDHLNIKYIFLLQVLLSITAFSVLFCYFQILILLTESISVLLTLCFRHSPSFWDTCPCSRDFDVGIKLIRTETLPTRYLLIPISQFSRTPLGIETSRLYTHFTQQQLREA